MLLTNDNCIQNTKYTTKHSDINLFIVGSFFYDQVVTFYSDFYTTPDFKFIYFYYYRFLVWGKNMNEILKRCKYNAMKLRDLSKWLAFRKKNILSALIYSEACVGRFYIVYIWTDS